MKLLEIFMVICGAIAAGAVVLLVVAIAMLPYAAVLAILLVCFRYLGWF